MKKTVFKVAALLFTGIGTTACGSSKQTAQAVGLTGEWNIVKVNGDTVNAANAPFIGLDMADKRVYGNAGCNRMTGSFEADSLHPGKIQFGQIGTTRMMCPDMETERKILDALGKVTSFSANADETVSLLDESGTEVLTLTRNAGTPLSEAQ